MLRYKKEVAIKEYCCNSFNRLLVSIGTRFAYLSLKHTKIKNLRISHKQLVLVNGPDFHRGFSFVPTKGNGYVITKFPQNAIKKTV